MNKIKLTLTIFTLFASVYCSAVTIPKASHLDPFYDDNADYSSFSGRVSDRDASNSIFKIYSEDKNIRFFKAGDPLDFTINQSKRSCQANIRDVEKEYIVIYVKNLMPCWSSEKYFRRGMILDFKSTTLKKRIEDASLYRMVLLKRREDYYKQMNEINHFVWSYDQQKILLAAEYDKEIVELQKKKQKALDEYLNKKKYNIHLQKELSYRLNVLEKDLKYYRLDPYGGEDRWAKDHDLGKSMIVRPVESISN